MSDEISHSMDEHDEGCPHHGTDHVCNGVFYTRSTPAPVTDEARRVALAELISERMGTGFLSKTGFETIRAALSAPSREKELMAVIADLAEAIEMEADPDGVTAKHADIINEALALLKKWHNHS